MSDIGSDERSVAIELLEGLRRRGIRYVFANAGTDFAPIIEAIVIAENQGRSVPEFVLVPHENLAMGMALGYYRACGEPAAVMVHVTVGTANALCGIMNSARDNIPVFLMAGKTPNTESGHPGSRGAMIHWGQDTFDQGGVVREYVKWDYELRAGQSADAVVGRALDIAMSEPRGPVYLTMPREVLGDPVVTGLPTIRNRALGSSRTAPPVDVIEDAAKVISNAELPLILTSSTGREVDNVTQLAALANEFAIPVIQAWTRDMNLPTDHPMNLGMMSSDLTERADVIVVLDCEVPWSPSRAGPGPDTKLIHIAPDPFFARYPLRGHEMDIAIAASASSALPMLYRELSRLHKGDTAKIEARREKITALWAAQIEKRNTLMKQVSDLRPIHPAWLAACVNKVKTPDTIVINEMAVPFDFLELSSPRSYITNSHAGGLGIGLGAALGARLASPDREVILLCGDGSYMFGNPTPAHYVARAEGLATLTVVANNQRWDTVNDSVMGMYPQGHAAESSSVPLVDLSPSPDYERVIGASGGYGERVENPDDLQAALERGLDSVRNGTPALINVITRTL